MRVISCHENVWKRNDKAAISSHLFAIFNKRQNISKEKTLIWQQKGNFFIVYTIFHDLQVYNKYFGVFQFFNELEKNI